MPKLKTHSGAAKRFSKTGTGKIKRGQTKTRHILTSKSPKSEAQAGQDPAGFRRRLQEGSAHDSLRLTTAWGSPLDRAVPLQMGRVNAMHGPRRLRNAFAAARDQA